MVVMPVLGMQVLPDFFKLMLLPDLKLQIFLIDQMTSLVSLLKQHLRKWVGDITRFIRTTWNPSSPLLPHTLALLREIAGKWTPPQRCHG